MNICVLTLEFLTLPYIDVTGGECQKCWIFGQNGKKDNLYLLTEGEIGLKSQKNETILFLGPKSIHKYVIRCEIA